MNHKTFKYFPYIISIYSFFFILPSILLHKIVALPFIGDIPISILFTGIYFAILDIVTEVYGYRECKKMLLSGLVTYTSFVFIIEFVCRIPSSPNVHAAWDIDPIKDAYQYMFGNLHWVWLSVVFCTLFANNLNSLVLSKWKVLVNGKYFWMRSMTTSFVAAFLYSSLSNFFAFCLFSGTPKLSLFINLTLVSLMAKMITLLIFSYPSILFVRILKRAEGVDAYDHHLSHIFFSQQTKHYIESQL